MRKGGDCYNYGNSSVRVPFTQVNTRMASWIQVNTHMASWIRCDLKALLLLLWLRMFSPNLLKYLFFSYQKERVPLMYCLCCWSLWSVRRQVTLDHPITHTGNYHWVLLIPHFINHSENFTPSLSTSGTCLQQPSLQTDAFLSVLKSPPSHNLSIKKLKNKIKIGGGWGTFRSS